MQPNETIDVMNDTATLTMSKDGKTTKLVVKDGFLPLLPLN